MVLNLVIICLPFLSGISSFGFYRRAHTQGVLETEKLQHIMDASNIVKVLRIFQLLEHTAAHTLHQLPTMFSPLFNSLVSD